MMNTKYINWIAVWDWIEKTEKKFDQFDKIEKIVRGLFPNFTEYELHSSSNIIKFRINNVSLENLIKLKEQTNRNINIDKCQFHPELGFWIVLT